MEPSLRKQFTTYNGRRYRMCVYQVGVPPHSEPGWAGFAEDSRVYLGGTGHLPSRALAMLAVARIISRHEAGRKEP